jgi:hypothetical protein
LLSAAAQRPGGAVSRRLLGGEGAAVGVVVAVDDGGQDGADDGDDGAGDRDLVEGVAAVLEGAAVLDGDVVAVAVDDLALGREPGGAGGDRADAADGGHADAEPEQDRGDGAAALGVDPRVGGARLGRLVAQLEAVPGGHVADHQARVEDAGGLRRLEAGARGGQREPGGEREA